MFLSGIKQLQKTFPLELDEPSDEDKQMNDQRIEIGEIEIGEESKNQLMERLRSNIHIENQLYSVYYKVGTICFLLLLLEDFWSISR